MSLSRLGRRQQARKIGAQFDRLIVQMRQLGEAAGKFAETNRDAGQTYTMEHVDTMAGAMVDEAKASVDVPLAGLRAAGVRVDVALDEAALRSAFRDGFLAGLGPDGMAAAPDLPWDAAAADAFAAFVADAMTRGRLPGRLFTAAEIDTATETVCSPCEREGPYSDIAEGMPANIKEAAASLGPQVFRDRVRRGLLTTLPPSIIAAEGRA